MIFVFLYFTFGSSQQGIFTAIHLSAIGGILALSLRDMPYFGLVQATDRSGRKGKVRGEISIVTR